MKTDTPQTIYLKDYQEPAYTAQHIDLDFNISEERTLVTAKTQFKKTRAGDETLVLNGEHMVLKAVSLDGKILENDKDYTLDETSLTILAPSFDEFTLEVATEINPAANTALEGLYKSGGAYCTQCEAEGFRRITYALDRPDVMQTFKVRIEADKKDCPVLLSNGNLIEDGDVDGERHFAVWHDPFPKPCYLFALVAGDLVHIEDTFRTCKGRDVVLRIYVRDGDETQCGHAMTSLKKSMKWDEDVYGRVYEYDGFNIVAVSDFNMGAMENTSLNIFNTALVLAHPETATDHDFMRVEGVVAHEYFHNWTGNRITCRDWFQLSLKEGLTVFRDQEFSSDMNSRGVQRIDDVTHLRRMQFPEDAGPLAHPVRPDQFITINNFYTMTVYEKGAEVIRMQHTLLGPETYRKATDLYFDRHDGQAVTCEDFVQCMADASGRDMGQFFRWYTQAGTPEIKASGRYDEESKTYTLSLSQSLAPTPGQKEKQPMLIPVRVGLLGPNGDDMAEELLELSEEKQDFVFENIPSQPVPSILRGFSAPVKLTTDINEAGLRFLMVHDNDGFNRWEAGQTYALRVLNRLIDAQDGGVEYNDVPADFLDVYGALLDQALMPGVDKALLARSLTLPDVAFIGQHREQVDPTAIYAVREKVIEAIARKHGEQLRKVYDTNRTVDPFQNDFEAIARRSLQNCVLRYLNDPALLKLQYDQANNMTDRAAALAALADMNVPAREEAFADFYERFKTYPLVVDKWFAMQAAAVRADTIHDVRKLKAHPDFTMTNPNRVRSLYAAFAMNNPVSFHDGSGSGYDFLTEAVIELNAINPQIAARMLTPFKEWRRYTPDRRAKMKACLERIAAIPDITSDVYEIVSKSLEG